MIIALEKGFSRFRPGDHHRYNYMPSYPTTSVRLDCEEGCRMMYVSLHAQMCRPIHSAHLYT